MYLPQHPVHYCFGMPSHAPLVIRAWINESVQIKVRLAAWYAAFFFFVGYQTGGFDTGKDLLGTFVFTTLIIGMPSAILEPTNKSLISSISDAFFNAVLTFHGFLTLYIVIHVFTNLIALYFNVWTVGLSSALLSICFGLMVGFSLQQAVATNSKLPWFIVPFLSLVSSCGIFYLMSNYGVR